MKNQASSRFALSQISGKSQSKKVKRCDQLYITKRDLKQAKRKTIRDWVATFCVRCGIHFVIIFIILSIVYYFYFIISISTLCLYKFYFVIVFFFHLGPLVLWKLEPLPRNNVHSYCCQGCIHNLRRPMFCLLSF